MQDSRGIEYLEVLGIVGQGTLFEVKMEEIEGEQSGEADD